MSQFKKYHPCGNLKFNFLDIFQSLKLHILMGKILSISLKLNFTPNTSGGYGLKYVPYRLTERRRVEQQDEENSTFYYASQQQ